MRDLEKDLWKIRDLVQDDDFAQHLYSSLCNIQWKHKDDPEDEEWYSMSWRYAGGVVAELRYPEKKENYLDWYCSGSEGYVFPEVEEELAKLGWSWREWPDMEYTDDTEEDET